MLPKGSEIGFTLNRWEGSRSNYPYDGSPPNSDPTFQLSSQFGEACSTRPSPAGHRRQIHFTFVRDEVEQCYGANGNLRDALPNASFIGLTSSLPPLGRASPNTAHCL